MKMVRRLCILMIKNIFIFYLGAILGSFLGLVAYRLPLNKKIINDRSKCDTCGITLRPKELIPLFSFIKLKGRCSYCNGKINNNIFFIELANGLLSLFHFSYLGISIESIIVFLAIEIFLVISFIDIKYKIIPDVLNLLLFLIFLTLTLIKGNLGQKIIYSFIFLVISLILYIVSKENFGLGDVKLFFVLIFFWAIDKFILNIFLSLIIATTYSLYKIYKKQLTNKDKIAFAPFINIAFLITLYFGDEILNFYFSKIG